MIAKGDQRPAADIIYKIFAKVQHKECARRSMFSQLGR